MLARISWIDFTHNQSVVNVVMDWGVGGGSDMGSMRMK